MFIIRLPTLHLMGTRVHSSYVFVPVCSLFDAASSPHGEPVWADFVPACLGYREPKDMARSCPRHFPMRLAFRSVDGGREVSLP